MNIRLIKHVKNLESPKRRLYPLQVNLGNPIVVFDINYV